MVNGNQKGKRAEREVVDLLREIFPEAARAFQFRGGYECGDIEGTPYRIEVKRRKARVDVPGAWKQLTEDLDDSGDSRPGLLIHRTDGQPWLVTLEATDLIALLRIVYGSGR